MYGINLKNVCKKMFVIFLLYFILSEREKMSSNFSIYARKKKKWEKKYLNIEIDNSVGSFQRH